MRAASFDASEPISADEFIQKQSHRPGKSLTRGCE